MPLTFRNSGGYRYLNDFTLATIIHLETIRFCNRFLNLKNDPKGRQYDQMVQAARSGRANIMEGSERNSTSRETEIKLIGVAKASLAELLGDYEIWLMQFNDVPWTSAESDAVFRVALDPPPAGTNLLHDSCRYYLDQRTKFAQWLDSEDSCVVAKCLLTLLMRTILMLQKHLERLGNDFTHDGGLRERMTAARLEQRDHNRGLPAHNETDAPKCPQCGKPMRKRKAKSSGELFWGCSDFPQCHGTRRVEETTSRSGG